MGYASTDHFEFLTVATCRASMMSSNKIRHEYFQTDKSVNVDIFIKNLKKEQVSVDFEPESVTVNIQTLPGTETVLDFALFHDIVPSECKFEILSTKLEIMLVKKAQGLKWASLEGNGRDGLASTMSNSTDKAPAYPSSARKVPKFSR